MMSHRRARGKTITRGGAALCLALVFALESSVARGERSESSAARASERARVSLDAPAFAFVDVTKEDESIAAIADALAMASRERGKEWNEGWGARGRGRMSEGRARASEENEGRANADGEARANVGANEGEGGEFVEGEGEGEGEERGGDASDAGDANANANATADANANATAGEIGVLHAKNVAKTLVDALDAAAKATKAEAEEAEAAKARAEAARDKRAERARAAREEAEQKRTQAAESEAQAQAEVSRAMAAKDGEIQAARARADGSNAGAANADAESKAAELTNARDNVEVWMLKVRQAQDDLDAAIKAASDALAVKDIVKSEEALAAATAEIDEKNAAQRAAEDAVTAAKVELENARQRVARQLEITSQARIAATDARKVLADATAEVEELTAEREQMNNDEVARKATSVAKESTRATNAQAVFEAKDKMVQCAQANLDRIAAAASEARRKSDAASAARDQAVALLGAINNADAIHGFDAASDKEDNECPLVIAEAVAFAPAVVAEVVEKPDDGHESEVTSSVPVTDRKTISDAAQEEDQSEGYPASKAEAAEEEKRSSESSEAVVADDDDQVKEPIPDESLVEQCDDCAAVSTEVSLSGYTVETFDEKAQKAFVSGMAQTLGVNEDEIVVTGVAAGPSYGARRSRSLLADDGVQIQFTVLVKDDATAKQVGADLAAVKTDPIIAETIMTNMVQAGLEAIESLEIPHRPEVVTKAEFAKKVIAVRDAVIKRDGEVHSKNRIVSKTDAASKTDARQFFIDAADDASTFWGDADSATRAVAVILIALAIFAIWFVLSLCFQTSKPAQVAEPTGESSRIAAAPKQTAARAPLAANKRYGTV